MKQDRLAINRLQGRGTSTFVQLPDDDCLRTRKTGRCTLPPSLIAAQLNFHLQLQMLAHFLIATLHGNKDYILYPNNTKAQYTYYPTYRIESITNTSGANVISSYAYAYDPNGNRTHQVETQNGASETTDYNYDVNDRLLNYTITGANETKHEYTYEGLNRKTEKVTQDNTVIRDVTNTYNNLNQLKGVRGT